MRKSAPSWRIWGGPFCAWQNRLDAIAALLSCMNHRLPSSRIPRATGSAADALVNVPRKIVLTALVVPVASVPCNRWRRKDATHREQSHCRERGRSPRGRVGPQCALCPARQYIGGDCIVCSGLRRDEVVKPQPKCQTMFEVNAGMTQGALFWKE